MAKTFKNLLPPVLVAPAKRASERDFFDLTDEFQPANISVITPATDPGSNDVATLVVPGNTSVVSNIRTTNADGAKRETSRSIKKSNTRNTHNTGVIGNDDKTGNHTSSEDSGSMGVATLSGDVRQTFVLSRHHLERLRDYVHARRSGGDYTYSQKQALQEALDLLFASAAPVETRPDQVKDREHERRERIKQGRRVGS
jgi:hypothetical protein